MNSQYQPELVLASDDAATAIRSPSAELVPDCRPSARKIGAFISHLDAKHAVAHPEVMQWLGVLAATKAPEGLFLYPQNARVTWLGADPGLTASEFRMVSLLAEAGGEFIGYRALCDSVHGTGFAIGAGPDGFMANTRTAIKRIRNKFLAVDPTFDQIENYPKFGYRWK